MKLQGCLDRHTDIYIQSITVYIVYIITKMNLMETKLKSISDIKPRQVIPSRPHPP